MAENKKKSGLHLTIGAITLVLGVLALVLFLLSFTTNYYTFGSLKSPLILTLILGGLVLTALSIWLHHKFPRNIWVRFVPFAVIACFAAAAMLLVGDRVEGIGTCIMTDYDSGHGGEEAIYMSLASSVLMLIAVVYNIIGCFHADPTAPGKKRNLIYSIVAAVLVVAVAVATIMLTGVLALNGKAVVSDGQGGYAAMRSGTYTVSFNQNSGNVDLVQDFEFIPGTTKGLLNYDSRLFLDLTLSLDGAGSYTLFAESYAMEAGKRCEIGDDTGLGMILTTKAEGSYVDNGDGTVTTSPATHAVAEFRLDTYSVQMKDPASIAVGEHKDEGSYDSAEYPEVLDLVPETVWTLADGAIVSYLDPNVEEASEEEPAAPAEESGEELSGVEILSDDGATRIVFYPTGTYEFCFDQYSISDPGSYAFVDGVLTLADANGVETTAEGDPLLLHYTYSQNDALTGDFTLPAEKLAFQAAESSEESGEELSGAEILSDDGATRIVFYPTGTYEFCFDQYNISDPGSYAFVDGVLTLTDANGVETTAEGDPLLLHYTYSQNEALTGDFTIPAEKLAFQAAEELRSATILSDDEGTKMTFNSDGTYKFAFESYGIEDLGTWTYVDGVLTLTDVNGLQYTAEGEPLHLHYGYSGAPDQLTGEYTIPADTFDFEELLSLTVVSDDRGTTMSFNSDGTYRFWFEPYQVEDLGAWQIADGILTLTDVNGVEIQAEGAPYKLHYVYSQNDALTGDFTIPVGIFPFPVSGTSIPSDDFGTGMTFFADGTYLFTFDSYSILDAGTWTFEDSVLTLTDANGVEYSADGETLHLHYGYSGAPDQLTGDFTIDPAIFAEKTEQ